MSIKRDVLIGIGSIVRRLYSDGLTGCGVLATVVTLLVVVGICSQPSNDARSGLTVGQSADHKAAPRLEFLGAHVGDHFPGLSGMKCDPADELKTRICFLRVQPKIGEVRVTKMNKRYLDDKLYSWGFAFESSDYDLLVAALTTKYGVPDSTAEGNVSLPGASMKQKEKYWTFADGQVAMSEVTDVDGAGGGGVYATGTAGLADLHLREAADSAKKLADDARRAAAAARDLGPPVKK